MLDSTGQMVLSQLRERLEKAGVSFLVAKMKRQFMQTIYRTNAAGPMAEEHYFSRLTFALAFAWTDLECDKCDNTKNCPYRVSVAKKLYEEREGIESDGEAVSSTT